MQRNANAVTKMTRRAKRASTSRTASFVIAALALSMASVTQSGFAQGSQDADSPTSAHGSASGDEARALVTLPNPPTPSAVPKVIPPANPPVLTDSATLGRQSTVTNSNALPAKPGARTADVTNQKPLDDALGGIVTNDAVTLVGQDFYNYFAAAWTQMPLSERYIVSIHELPSARYGSLIWVEYDQRRVFQAFLPIARSNVRPVAESAAASALQTVMQADIARLLFHEADLGSDEM